jgi:hypothetical protein
MQHPFSLRIFVVDGDPDGLRLVERSNWIGKAIVFPRSLLPKVKQREEFNQTGIYLLLGPREDGEGEMLYKRLPLDNSTQPTEPSLSEADRADMQVFLENILGMLPILGIHAFEQAPAVFSNDLPPTILTCRGKGVIATGFEATQGFVVKSDSQAMADTVPSMQHNRGFYELRQELIQNGVLQRQGESYCFSQNYTFSSPSAAASIVLGRSANGRIEWKTSNGKTLKDRQMEQADVDNNE